MKHFKHFLFCISLLFFLMFSCNDEDENNISSKSSINAIYTEAFCGGLMTVNNQLVTSICETYKDSLLVVTNKEDFVIFQSLQFSDEVSIEFELTEFCEGLQDCAIMGNRYNGIPIKILTINKE